MHSNINKNFKKVIFTYIIVLLILFLLINLFIKGVVIGGTFKTPCYHLKYIKGKNEYSILIIESFDETHFSSQPQVYGFISGLKQLYPDKKFDVFSFYMKTNNRYFREVDKESRAITAYEFYKQIKPDFVYTVDDNAFKYFAPLIIRKQPVYFSGLNNHPKEYLYDISDRQPFIGVCEKFDNTVFFDFLRMINIYPDSIIIIYDNSISSFSIANYWRNNFIQEKFHVNMIKITTTSQLKKLKNKYNPDIIFVANQAIYDEYKRRYERMSDMITTIDEFFPKTIIIYPNENQLCFGGTVGFGPDYRNMGFEVAKLLFKDIKVDTVLNSKSVLSVKLSSFKRLNIPISNILIKGLNIHVY